MSLIHVQNVLRTMQNMYVSTEVQTFLWVRQHCCCQHRPTLLGLLSFVFFAIFDPGCCAASFHAWEQRIWQTADWSLSESFLPARWAWSQRNQDREVESTVSGDECSNYIRDTMKPKMPEDMNSGTAVMTASEWLLTPLLRNITWGTFPWPSIYCQDNYIN